MSELTTAYARIIKSEKQEDGTLLVYGKATDDSLDIDQQICDSTWLDRAMPDWFKSGGNIREQHSNIAAGVAKEYEQKNDGHYISALVVDPVSVKKVETGVLKGFSIGIKAPRIIRDQKAANGRIIDGQIVEVSLVDRPANPNAKLMLAKTVKGKKKLAKVEELIEKSLTASQLIDLAKSVAPTVQKFDAATYDAARRALAQLIVVEANEMSEQGHNEEISLSHLLAAIHHLFEWYEGEEAEGEVTEIIEEKSETVDTAKADDTDEKLCKECGKAIDDCECEAKEAKTEDEALQNEVDGEKSAEAHKCLECGCGNVTNNHGGGATNDFANVAKPAHMTSAVIVTPDESPKAVEGDVTKNSETEKVEDALPTEKVDEIIEKALKSAKESVLVELDALKSAKEAVEKQVEQLQSDLAVAKSMAVAGGPKRTVIKAGNSVNEMLVKAASYNAKAASTTDPDLAKGYSELAKSFYAKAQTPEQDSEQL